MKTRQIFLIDGREGTKKQSTIRGNKKIANKSGNQHINYWSGFHVFTILCSCVLAVSILTVMPRHNSIIDQSYWFDINIVTASLCFISRAVILLDFIVLFGKSSVVTIRFFLKNYLANFLTRVIGFLVVYMIWTKILEYNHPMPWWGLILYFPNKIVLLMLPREFSFEEKTKKKLKNFIWLEFGWILAGIIKTLLGTSFEKLRNTDAQCLMALMFLMSKKFVSFFLSKLMNRIVGSDNERANCNLTTHINLSYGVFIATCCIGARPATVVCLVAVDALMQLIMSRILL